MSRKRFDGLPWSAAELAVVDRHLAMLGSGRYRTGVEAAGACRAEMMRRGLPARSIGAVRLKVVLRAPLKNVRWFGVTWSEAELRVARRFARAVMAGKYRSALAATEPCRAALRRLAESDRRGGRVKSSVERPYHSVHDILRREAHALRWPRAHVPWSDTEERVLLDHYRALVEGRFRFVDAAAAACHAELARLHRRQAVGDGPPIEPRTRFAVHLRLHALSGRTRLPRYRGVMTAAEAKVVERYALAVHHGRYSTWKDAARACREHLRRRAERSASRRAVGVRQVYSHNLHSLHTAILDVAHRLHLNGPRRVLWTPPELAICRSWVRWLDRHRRSQQQKGFAKVAIAGVQEELEQIGITRSLSGCEAQLAKQARLLHHSPGPAG